MAIAHTNISKMTNSSKYGNKSEQSNLQFLSNANMQEDDEEWNVGGYAEETIMHNTSKMVQQLSSNSRYAQWIEPWINRIGLGKDNYQRSSTTKSGSSSIGHANHGTSTKNEIDSFFTLECDENLYEDEKTLEDFDGREENKTYCVPVKNKLSKVDAQIRNHLSKEK